MAYGLATIAFGLSRSFWLSFGCLAATGAADTISTIFRNLIRQLETPDRLRGRMAARKTGRTYTQLIGEIVELALARYAAS